jgi:hypothetical protein
VFIPARRYVSAAESAAAVYGNQVRIRPNLWLHVRLDLADVATVAHVFATDVRANANNTVGRRDRAAGLPAHSRVEDGREMRKAGGFCVFKGRKVSKQPRRLVEIKMSVLPALAGSQRS